MSAEVDFEVWEKDAPVIILDADPEFGLWDKDSVFLGFGLNIGGTEPPAPTGRRRCFFID